MSGERKLSRRDFLKLAAVTGVGVVVDRLVNPPLVKAMRTDGGPFVPAEVKKKPRKEFKEPIYSVENAGPRIFLTIDDGYFPDLAKEALGILKKHNLKLTFFIIGKNLRAEPELWRQAVADGHQICNHTFSHPFMTKITEDEAKKQIIDWEQAAKEVFGEKYLQKMKEDFPFFRFPCRDFNTGTIKLAKELGYIVVDWTDYPVYAVTTDHSYNFLSKNAELVSQKVAERVCQKSKPNSGYIWLLHTTPWEMGKFEEILLTLEKNNLTIVPVSEIFN